jgi:curved DNA-binding protein CbpA
VDTFELLPSLAQGDLRATSAAELVAAVLRSRASGTLVIETARTGEIRAFFRTGDMCGTASFTGAHTLAHVMLANDWADALQIESTQEAAAKSGKRHGEILVEQGLLTAEQLRSALAAQHRDNLALLLGLSEGTYEWRGWEPPPAWAVEVVVDPVSCIVDALETQALQARRDKLLHWLGGRMVRLSADWPELQSRAALTEGDRRAASLLTTARKVAQFLSDSRLPPQRAEAVLAALLLVGGAEPAGTQAPDASASTPAHVELRPIKEPRVKEARTRTPPPDTDRLRRATVDETPLELDTDADARGREVRLRMRKQGLRNLGLARQEPEASRSVEQVQLRETPVSDAAPAQAADAETAAFVIDVRRRLAALEGQNAYARLGVTSNASQEQIKQAYLGAAKKYHPDRAAATPGLGGILPELQKLFSALKEAHDHIGTAPARTKYDQQLRHAATGKMSSKEEAALEVKMGEVLLKKRDFEGALQKLRHAVELDANADALAALAWAIVSDPKATAAGKEESMTLINRALRAPGTTARTYYVAGVLWRSKDPASAADAFRKALELDPKHTDSSLELRVLESRQGKAVKGGGVLSGLLFGKRK